MFSVEATSIFDRVCVCTETVVLRQANPLQRESDAGAASISACSGLSTNDLPSVPPKRVRKPQVVTERRVLPMIYLNEKKRAADLTRNRSA